MFITLEVCEVHSTRDIPVKGRHVRSDVVVGDTASYCSDVHGGAKSTQTRSLLGAHGLVSNCEPGKQRLQALQMVLRPSVQGWSAWKPVGHSLHGAQMLCTKEA
jgi:hypothetical protein